MKDWIHFVLIGIFALIIVVGAIIGDASTEDRARAVGARIMCPVCQGSAIVGSPSETATAMMDKVEEQVAAGWSDDQILTFFRDRYGESIILDPAFSGRTLVVWLLPMFALGVGVWMIVQRRRVLPLMDEEP